MEEYGPETVSPTNPAIQMLESLSMMNRATSSLNPQSTRKLNRKYIHCVLNNYINRNTGNMRSIFPGLNQFFHLLM